MIFEYQEKDFRNRQNFDYLRSKYLPSLALGNGITAKLKNFINRNIYFLRNVKPVIWGEFKYPKYLRFMGTNCISHENLTRQFFRATKTKALIGIDDPSFGRPFIKGCRDSGMITIGVQHGLYGAENIGYSDIEKSIPWYDYLICWDKVSKQIFMENNKSYSGKRILIGADFFLTGRAKGEVKDTIFLIGEENIDSSLLDNIVSMMLKDNWNVLCLMKGGHTGSKPGIKYVPSISDVPFEKCAAVIGSKSSLVYQLYKLNIPTFIVPCGEGYLAELCKYISLNQLSHYSKADFEDMLGQFQPLMGYDDDPLFCENISTIFSKEKVLFSGRGVM